MAEDAQVRLAYRTHAYVRDAYVPRGTQIVPEEIANVAAFLASDASAAVNGTELYADGGSAGCTYGP